MPAVAPNARIRRDSPSGVRRLAAAAAAPALCSVLVVATAFAGAEGRVRIKAPANGAAYDRGVVIRLAYDVLPGPDSHHVHVYLDGTEHGVLRRLKGIYGFAPLSPGRHELCIKAVNRAHVPIGAQECVTITVR